MNLTPLRSHTILAAIMLTLALGTTACTKGDAEAPTKAPSETTVEAKGEPAEAPKAAPAAAAKEAASRAPTATAKAPAPAKAAAPPIATGHRPTAVKAPVGPIPKDAVEVEASCGQCNFGLTEPRGCDLAVRIDGKAYFVDGSKLDDHGDAHARRGMCNIVRRAAVTGKVVNDRYQATSFRIVD